MDHASGKSYSTQPTFNQVDWADLYDRHDGYLLFEDLKKQWNRAVRPDYVLIDSRTGHTDTCGICTRQLPDSVVVLFFSERTESAGIDRGRGRRSFRSQRTAKQDNRASLRHVQRTRPG